MTCQCRAGPCQEHMTGLFCFTAPHHATARLATAREPGFAVGQLADLAAARNSEGVVP
jgi:hypothetical protein